MPCRKIAISNNVGGVKHCLRTLRPALGDERHFALADGFRFPTKLASNRCGQELSPTQPSLRSQPRTLLNQAFADVGDARFSERPRRYPVGLCIRLQKDYGNPPWWTKR